MGETQVYNCAHIVWSQINCQLIRPNTLFCLQELRAGRSILIPQRVIQRLFLDCSSEVNLCLSEVALKELKDTQGEQNLSIAWVLHVCNFESILDFNEVKISTLCVRNLLVVRVVLQPLVHVVKCVLFC